MLKGVLIIVVFVVLALLASANLEIKDEAAEQAALEQQKIMSEFDALDIYMDKYMYSQACAQYQSLIKSYPNDIGISDKFISFCEEYGYKSELTAECIRRLELNKEDKNMAQKILNSYYESGSTKIYKFMNTNKALLSDTELYKKIKAESLSKLREIRGSMTDISDWQVLGYTYVKNNGKEGVANAVGTIVIPMAYDDIISYSQSESLIAIKEREQLVYTNYAGDRAIVPYDTKERKLIYLDYLGPFESGVANVCKDGVWGYANKDLNIDYLKYKETAPLSFNVSAILKDDGWHIINTNFSEISAAFEDIYRDESGYCCSNNIIYLKSGGKWEMYKTVFDESGLVTGISRCSDLCFDDVKTFGDYGAVCVNGKWGFIKSDGTWLIEPVYSDAYSFRCGLAPVLTGGKWGFISENGDMIIPATYEGAISFSKNGVTAVKSGDTWKFIQLYEYYYLGR